MWADGVQHMIVVEKPSEKDEAQEEGRSAYDYDLQTALHYCAQHA